MLWGSAVAPPLVLLAALVGAAATGRRDWLGGLGGVLVVGQLSEPIVYERSGLPEDRWVRRSVVANLALGSMLVARWRAAAYGSGRVGSAAGR